MKISMLTVYIYDKCSTCRNALKWLDAKGIAYQTKAIRETPPPQKELKAMLDAREGNIRKLLNTSSQDYRELGIKDKLDSMKPTEVFALMKENGNLVKRPFIIGDGIYLTGFREAEWKENIISKTKK